MKDKQKEKKDEDEWVWQVQQVKGTKTFIETHGPTKFPTLKTFDGQLL